MNLRLKTNIDVESKLNELQSLLQVSSKAAVIRLAISYSIRLKTNPTIFNGEKIKYDLKQQNGADYNRFTIYGEDEFIYKLLMEQSIKKAISDDQFFPEFTNAHLCRGINELLADVKLANTKEKFLRDTLNRK